MNRLLFRGEVDENRSRRERERADPSKNVPTEWPEAKIPRS